MEKKNSGPGEITGSHQIRSVSKTSTSMDFDVDASATEQQAGLLLVYLDRSHSG